MTHLSTAPVSRLASVTTSQEGPVLLATKPFSGHDATVDVAQWLAAREDRALHVVTVLEQGEALATAAGMSPPPSQFYELQRLTIASQIRQELTRGGSGADLARVDVLDEWSARAIVDTARECNARVIVIGTGRHDTIGRLVYGERALEIIGIADRPVLIVPGSARTGSVADAVVAVDFSPASLRAARAALPMLAERSRLRLVHVKAAGRPYDEPLGWSDEPCEQHGLDLFKRFLRQVPSLPGVSVETMVLCGDTAQRIIEYAKSCDAGLIACGRLGHSFVERVFIGSVSSALVRRSVCPVLVAPELAGDALAL